MSLNDIISILKTYSWSFYHGDTQVSLSAIATSEEDARAELLSLFSQIEEKLEDYEDIVRDFQIIFQEVRMYGKMGDEACETDYYHEICEEKDRRMEKMYDMEEEIASLTHDLTGPSTFEIHELPEITDRNGLRINQILMSPPTSIAPFKKTVIFAACC